MKKSMFTLLAILLFVFASAAHSQVMHNLDPAKFAWDASQLPKNSAGANIPGVMKYQAWSKPAVLGETGVKVGGEIVETQIMLSFPAYVAAYPGVQAVFYPSATPTVPYFYTIAWSTSAAACAGGVTFGVLYLPVLDTLKNLRVQ